MGFFFAALAVSFLVTLLVIRVNFARHSPRARAAADRRAVWVRESNLRGLGRAGGLGVAMGLLVSLLVRLSDDAPAAVPAAQLGLLLLAGALPVFGAGLIEDFVQGLGISVRLLAALVSAAIAGFALDAWIVRFDMPFLDAAVGIPAISIVATCLAVAGLTNAFNIIDGFNGLAGGVAGLILLGIAYVAFKVGDVAVLAAALTAVGAIAGFMLLNFPRGLVYLGDGGAYLIGFWIAELLVLLVSRNHQVSAWFPVLLCSYPAFEMLFTIYRRLLVRRAHPGLPDAAHLHHLIYKRLVRWLVGTGLPAHGIQRNALTSPYLWAITSVGVAPALVFWRDTAWLQAGSLSFAAAYIYSYARIVRFRAPRWWVLRKRVKHQDETREK